MLPVDAGEPASLCARWDARTPGSRCSPRRPAAGTPRSRPPRRTRGRTQAAWQMLPVEVGDRELRAGIAEVRELLGGLRGRARELVRTLGR